MNARAGGLVLELNFVVGAPRERIFGALTEPAELARWWGPRGFTTPGIDLDLRVGGGYRFAMQPPGGDAFHLSGEFLQIDPPGRLACTFRWDEPDPDDRPTVVTLCLGDLADATQVSLSQASSQPRRGWHCTGAAGPTAWRSCASSSSRAPSHPRAPGRGSVRDPARGGGPAHAAESARFCRGQIAGWTLAERHAVLLKRLLQEPQRLRPHTVQLPQLGNRHVR